MKKSALFPDLAGIKSSVHKKFLI
eukprot:COSAG02_NODE_42362_length_385_cov_0.765734_1_plen_23_part_01